MDSFGVDGGVYGGKGTVYIKGMGGRYSGIHQIKDFGFLIFQNQKISRIFFRVQKIFNFKRDYFFPKKPFVIQVMKK
jgi:hypothetical protein